MDLLMGSGQKSSPAFLQGETLCHFKACRRGCIGFLTGLPSCSADQAGQHIPYASCNTAQSLHSSTEPLKLHIVSGGNHPSTAPRATSNSWTSKQLNPEHTTEAQLPSPGLSNAVVEHHGRYPAYSYPKNQGVLCPVGFLTPSSPKRNPCAGESVTEAVENQAKQLTFSPLVPFNPRTPSAPWQERNQDVTEVQS